jgi:hypothetical protein
LVDPQVVREQLEAIGADELRVDVCVDADGEAIVVPGKARAVGGRFGQRRVRRTAIVPVLMRAEFRNTPVTGGLAMSLSTFTAGSGIENACTSQALRP